MLISKYNSARAMKPLITNFLDTNIIQSQNYLFALYKQYREQTCLCIDRGVVQAPMMKPRKKMYHDEYTRGIFVLLN